jgi:hypothetical protein
MTATLGDPATASLARRQPTALCVLVGAVVVVGWVLYRHYWFDEVSRRAYDLFHVDSVAGVSLVIALLLCLPYAVVLLLWGRGFGPAVGGAAVALVAGLAFFGIDRYFQDHVFDPNGHTGREALRAYAWSELLVVALLVPLAWGLARRRGRAWVAGVLVGPVVAAVLRELQMRWSWMSDHVNRSRSDYRWQGEALVYVAPFVLAVLACWALEVRTRRTAK